MLEYCEALRQQLQKQTYQDEPVRVWIDDRDLRGGEKNWQHIKRGVPLRMEVGPRDVQAGAVFLGRRDQPVKQKQSVPREELVAQIAPLLDEIQSQLFDRALALQQQNTQVIDSLSDFRDYFTPQNSEKPEIHGGFALCHWQEDPEVDELLKKLKVTIRCLPLNAADEPGKCLFTGRSSARRAIFAKAY